MAENGDELELNNTFTMAYFEALANNASRYEEQFEKLLRERVLVVPFQNVIIKYVLKGRHITHSVSRDNGNTYSVVLTKSPVRWRARSSKAQIIQVFAHSEARELIGE